MIVSCGHDIYQCGDAGVFESIMQKLLAEKSAEVWISQNGEQDEYPCMALLVNENNAVLNHFGDDGSCYSSCNGSAKEGFVSFCDGQYEIHADQIISKEEAMTALMDYYMNNGRSIKIQWNQLY
jgi:hypothetical protein